MSTTTENKDPHAGTPDSAEPLRKNKMMSRLLDALEAGDDIGHYGRLTFAMVACWLMDEKDVIKWLVNDDDFDYEEAQTMVQQVRSQGYSPPRPAKIRDWDTQQDFKILPEEFHPDDDANVYRDLDFPQELYDHIQDYHQRND